MKTVEKLEIARNKILDGLVWASPKPDSPIVFAMYLLQVLDESDFDAIEAAEKEDEPAMTRWFEQLYEAAGVPTPSREAPVAHVG